MSWHGPWVLVEIFVRGGGRGAIQKRPHIEKRPPITRKRTKRPSHREKGLQLDEKSSKKSPHMAKRASIRKKVAKRPSHGEKRI